MCPQGSILLRLRREDRPRDPDSKDSERRRPIRSLESGVSTADSQAVGFGVAFDRKAAGDQEAECGVERVQLTGPRRSPCRFAHGASRRFAALGGRRICNTDAMRLHNPPICNTIG